MSTLPELTEFYLTQGNLEDRSEERTEGSGLGEEDRRSDRARGTRGFLDAPTLKVYPGRRPRAGTGSSPVPGVLPDSTKEVPPVSSGDDVIRDRDVFDTSLPDV